jgi:hypothetical protein
MKNLFKGLLCLAVIFISVHSNAQNKTVPVREPDMNKPTLFQNLPDKISCRIDDLSVLLQSEISRTVSYSFADNVDLRGVVSSVASKFDNKLQSVVIRLTNYPGAALTFSKVVKEDGTISFVGRIISFQHGDSYEITEENGQYFFIKKGFYDLVNE